MLREQGQCTRCVAQGCHAVRDQCVVVGIADRVALDGASRDEANGVFDANAPVVNREAQIGMGHECQPQTFLLGGFGLQFGVAVAKNDWIARKTLAAYTTGGFQLGGDLLLGWRAGECQIGFFNTERRCKRIHLCQ